MSREANICARASRAGQANSRRSAQDSDRHRNEFAQRNGERSLRRPTELRVGITCRRHGIRKSRTRSAPRHRLSVPVCAERVNFCAIAVCSACGRSSWGTCCRYDPDAGHSGVSQTLKADGRGRCLRGRKHYKDGRLRDFVG